jgi:aconitate hydratase 2/2-methylisocitrate dehydratase
MPLDMPESVLVKFKGKLNPGITWRDAVNAIPYFALQEGKLSLEKKNKKNIFNSRIMEIEGLENISVDQAFEFTDASAERSAEAATIALPIKAVTEYLKNNLTVLKTLKNEGYGNEALTKRIKAIEDWLAQPKLLVRDAGAKYAETIKIDLAKITEPLLACPNDPDNIKNLSTVAGQKIDEVFIGSCMTNVDHFDIISKMLEKADKLKVKLWLAPPTRLIEKILKDSGVYQKLQRLGAKIEIPGCSLCMGNQARVADRAIVFSTSTRNFDNRMGKEAQVYLGSAELAAIIAILGKIPTVEEYFFCIDKK